MVNAHLTRVLNPVRVVLIKPVVSPHKPHRGLVVHRNGVIAGVRNPHGSLNIINFHPVSGRKIVASLTLNDGQLGHGLNLQRVSIKAGESRDMHVPVSGSRHPQLMVLLRIRDLELAR